MINIIINIIITICKYNINKQTKKTGVILTPVSAGNESRTRTIFLSRDFKSLASAYSAIPAKDKVQIVGVEPTRC